MEIVFEEIMAGERGRAHDVLASSLPDDIARSLAHRLDLPGQLPPGFKLENFVSGFPHGSRYVVARTSLDPSAARQGMVFSHALVAELGAIRKLVDIATIFERLRSARPKVPFASKTVIEISDYERNVRPAPAPVLCDMLGTNSDFPAVTGDPLALEELISALWPRLLPDMRCALRFRLSFGPEESGIANLDVVAVPSVTVTRWPPERVINLALGPVRPITATGRFLSGTFTGDLNSFLEELSVHCKTFQSLRLVARAFELSRAEPTFAGTLAALRLIGSLQPEPSKGVTVKKRLLEELANHPGPNTAQELLALRNLNLAPFLGKAAFHSKITERFGRLFEAEAKAEALLPVMQSAADTSESTGRWRNSCIAALDQLSPAGIAKIAPLIWMLLSDRAEHGLYLLQQLDSIDSIDCALAKCLDSATELTNPSLPDELIAAGFVRAEAAILISRNDGVLLEGLREACQRDQHRYGTGAIKHILELIKPADLVSAALTVDNPIVMSAAATAVASSPTLLAEQSLRESQVRRVWIEALNLEPSAWRIRTNLGTLRNEVFDRFLGEELESDLLGLLISSPLGNALDYLRRKELWRTLSGRCREICLVSTAEAWTRSLPARLSQTGYLEPETELAAILASQKMSQRMKKALERLAFEDVLQVYWGNPQLTDAILIEVFASFYKSNGHSLAEGFRQAARLVAAQNRRGFTRALLQRYGMAEHLREFFHTCSDHLTLWDRIHHGIGRPSKRELDDFLIETACDLYPSGPKDGEIWDRAGGNLSQLDLSGNGRRQWRAAVRAIRNGNQVTKASLVAAMQSDYPSNSRLEHLVKECE